MRYQSSKSALKYIKKIKWTNKKNRKSIYYKNDFTFLNFHKYSLWKFH